MGSKPVDRQCMLCSSSYPPSSSCGVHMLWSDSLAFLLLAAQGYVSRARKVALRASFAVTKTCRGGSKQAQLFPFSRPNQQ